MRRNLTDGKGVTVSSLGRRYAKARKKHDATRERLEAELKGLGYGPSWVNRIIRPIAKLLATRMPDRRWEILGPFGLCAETAVHFYLKGVSEEEQTKGDNCRSITFIPGDLEEGQLMIRDYRESSREFGPGTIGGMNGMNYRTVPIPEDAGVEWLLQWVR